MSLPLRSRKPVTFVITCDWSKAIAPPIIALRRILKIIGRTYKGRCLRCDLDPLDDPPDDSLEPNK